MINIVRYLAAVALGIILIVVPVRVHDSGLPEDEWWVAACGPVPGWDRCGHEGLVAHMYTPLATVDVHTWGVQVVLGSEER